MTCSTSCKKGHYSRSKMELGRETQTGLQIAGDFAQIPDEVFKNLLKYTTLCLQGVHSSSKTESKRTSIKTGWQWHKGQWPVCEWAHATDSVSHRECDCESSERECHSLTVSVTVSVWLCAILLTGDKLVISGWIRIEFDQSFSDMIMMID